MARLREFLLQTVPQMQCSPCTSHVTLALLNVRLIVPKLADIEADCELNSANVLCFCEIEQEAVEHRASDRQCKAKWRANETEQATVERRTSNKQRMARKRATDNIAVAIGGGCTGQE